MEDLRLEHMFSPEATKQIQTIKGPLFLEGLAQSLKSPGTWKDWMTDKWGDGVFPGIFIGAEMTGTEFLLLLSTGRLLSIHHDSLQEVAWNLVEEASSREQFLEALITKGSQWSLPQLFQLQIALEKLGLDSFMRMDDETLEQVRASRHPCNSGVPLNLKRHRVSEKGNSCNIFVTFEMQRFSPKSWSAPRWRSIIHLSCPVCLVARGFFSPEESGDTTSDEAAIR